MYDAGVPIWHHDTLWTLARIVDIGHIRDEANVAAPWRGAKVELQRLNKNLVVTVE